MSLLLYVCDHSYKHVTRPTMMTTCVKTSARTRTRSVATGRVVSTSCSAVSATPSASATSGASPTSLTKMAAVRIVDVDDVSPAGFFFARRFLLCCWLCGHEQIIVLYASNGDVTRYVCRNFYVHRDCPCACTDNFSCSALCNLLKCRHYLVKHAVACTCFVWFLNTRTK